MESVTDEIGFGVGGPGEADGFGAEGGGEESK